MPDFVRILIVIALFAVIIVLVLKGKLGTTKGSESQAKDGVVDEKRAKKYGPVEKAYLISCETKNTATYEVHYQSGKSATEIVAPYSPRHEALKEKEPQRADVKSKKSDIIEITYVDGRVIDCKCSWINFEAAELRQQMLSKKPAGRDSD